MKEKGKEHGDLKSKATGLEIGEKVLVENLIKDNKLTPNFNPAHTVTDVRGCDVIGMMKPGKNIVVM